MKGYIIHMICWLGFSAMIHYGTGMAVIESIVWAGIIMAGMIVTFTDAIPTHNKRLT